VQDETYLKLEPQQKREKTIEALRDLLVRISQDKPLILAIEDLHWIDKTSEEFLSYLIDWLANSSILLLLLYRPEYTHSWGSKSYYSKIGVGHLSSLTSAELVQSILEEAEVVPELNELILNRSGGIPLFMEEFTHSLLENGTIQQRDKQYVLSRKGAEIDIPGTIEGIIAARIDRLEENLKRTMQVASVIGREFAFRILQTTTGMKEDLKSHLINLQGLEFIYEKRLFPELEYIFKHIMTQEVAYNSLLVRRRKEIHESIGQAIEQVYAERLEEFYEMLAYHYLKAEILEKAAHYLKLSGIKATSIHAPREAFYHFTEALTVLKRLPESDENKRGQIEVSLLMYPAMMFLGQPEGSLEILEHGAKLSEQLEDQRSLVTFYGNLALHYHQKGDPLPGLEYGEKAYGLAVNMHDTQLVAATSFDLINVYMNLGEYTKLVSICTHVIDLLEKNKMETNFCERPMAIYPVSCAYCAVGKGCLGDFEKGKIYIEKGLKVAETVQDQFTLALTEFMCGYVYLSRGEGKPAFDHFQIALKCADEVKQTVLSAGATCALGVSYGLMGEYESARKNLEAGIAILKEIQVEFLLSEQLCSLSWIHYEMGDYETASSLIEKAVSLAQKHHEKWSEGYSRIWLGRIVGKLDPSQHNRAEKSILEGIDMLKSPKAKPFYAIGYLALGELYSDSGQTEKAMENLKISESMFKEMGMDYWLARTREVIERI
jgi:tetratricopeptide (TPR) repeat protein